MGKYKNWFRTWSAAKRAGHNKMLECHENSTGCIVKLTSVIVLFFHGCNNNKDTNKLSWPRTIDERGKHKAWLAHRMDLLSASLPR